MKEIVRSPELMERSFEAISCMHQLITEFRNIVKEFEEITITLEGEIFGDLLVVEKVNSYKINDNSEIYMPMWRCECECGEEIVVSHMDLIMNNVTCCDEHKGE